MMFNRAYALLSLLILSIEVLIAAFIHDSIIRPFIGDMLVVILLYCTVKTFVDAGVIRTALAVLLFAYAVEFAQYFRLIYRLGWQNSRLARLTLGTSFSVTDLAMYTLGFILIIAIEYTGSAKRTFKL